MLPKLSRLTRQDIETRLKRAQRVKTLRFLVMYSVLGERRPRISMIVSKKLANKAVSRNLLRRRGYEALHSIVDKVVPGANILVSYQKYDEKTPLTELSHELEEAFRKARLIKSN